MPAPIASTGAFYFRGIGVEIITIVVVLVSGGIKRRLCSDSHRWFGRPWRRASNGGEVSSSKQQP
jgi:branched-subunit amino acid permease